MNDSMLLKFKPFTSISGTQNFIPNKEISSPLKRESSDRAEDEKKDVNSSIN